MKRKKIICACLVMVICLALCVCLVKVFLPVGLYFPVKGFPRIEEFSGTEYEEACDSFPAASHAILYTEERQFQIAGDDPRLIRLLNAIGYSNNENLSGHRYCEIHESTIEEFKATAYLEVHFPEPVQFGNELSNITVLIAQKEYMILYTDVVVVDSIVGNVYSGDIIRPYMALLTGIFWRVDNFEWFDLLAYAGFYDE